jgi:hypothetical protein
MGGGSKENSVANSAMVGERDGSVVDKMRREIGIEGCGISVACSGGIFSSNLRSQEIWAGVLELG